MRISPNKPVNTNARERGLLLAGLIGIIGLLVWALLPSGSLQFAENGEEQFFCGAEYVRNEYFVKDEQRFNGVEYRSRLRSRSGRHSILFPADGNNHFGFSTVLEQPTPGTVYEITVWTFGNEAGDGKLAVQGRNPGGFYEDSAATEQVDERGWAQHRLRIVVPFQNAPEQLTVYVYSTGKQEVFFDDLLIKKVSQGNSDVFSPTRLELNIDQRSWNQLEQKRQDALRSGLLQTGSDDWVDARLRDGEWQREIKLRLKGDWLDHLRGDKWSFRVKLKKDDSWRGLQTFSLHTPAARYYLHEWLLHQYWTKLGVLTTDYDFVELIINGESRGIYAYEEHFEKQLVESRQRREGPIVKFSEEGFWAGIQRQLSHHGFVRPGSGLPGQNPSNATVAAFNEEELAQDTTQNKLLQNALARLRAYQEGSASADEVFDLPLLARYYAACDLFNAYHGIIWHNQRFYYNPITTELEPIGFDGFAERPSRRYHFLAEGRLHREAAESTSLPAYFLQDSSFISTYISVLDSLSQPQHWDQFIEEILPALTARQQYLSREFSDYELNLETLRGEVAFVRAHLLPFNENCIRASKNANGELELENTHTLPLRVVGYSPYPSQMASAFPDPVWLPAGPVRSLYSKVKQSDAPIAFRSVDFWNDEALAFQETPYQTTVKLPNSAKYLFVQPAGIDTTLAIPLRISPSPEQLKIGRDAFRTASSPTSFPTLIFDQDKRMILIPAGLHQFQQDLIVPADYTLHLAAGAKVALDNESAIISYGAVYAQGSADKPVELFTKDGSGQGLQVIQAARASLLNQVIFRGLRNLHKENWMLTGAVTFYESAVQLEACRFLDNQSEDALNLVRSEFQMNHCLVQNTTSDGLDADFCKGTISESQFIHTTNDGVDFSGSIITLNNVLMQNCGDKGLSAGEASDITLLTAEIKNCNIGIASKDQSTVHGRRLIIEDCAQALVAFQKKPEYGPAMLLVEGLEAENNDRLYQIAPGSRLQIDDELIFE